MYVFRRTVVGFAALIGCTGEIGPPPLYSSIERGPPGGDPGAMTHGGAAGGKAGAGGSAGAGTGGGGAPAACAVPATRIWKLTPTQYTRTVQDLLKTTLVPTADLRGSLSSPDGFSNKADVEQMSEPHTGELRRLAELMAREAIGKKAELSPCLGVAPLADACVRAFIADFGGRAFRRPLETGAYDEAGAYLAFFNSTAATPTPSSCPRTRFRAPPTQELGASPPNESDETGTLFFTRVGQPDAQTAVGPAARVAAAPR